MKDFMERAKKLNIPDLAYPVTPGAIVWENIDYTMCSTSVHSNYTGAPVSRSTIKSMTVKTT